MDVINGYDIFKVKQAMLKKIDKDLVDHGLETAYIACLIGEELGYDEEKLYYLRVAAILHDIGAYKTEATKKIKEFEVTDTDKHSVYGYSIFKQNEKLNHISTIILYHHHSYSKKDEFIDGIEIPEESFLISLADRVSIACNLLNYKTDKIKNLLYNMDKSIFNPKYVDILYKLIENKSVIEAIVNRTYKEDISKILMNSKLNLNLVNSYLSFLPLTVDFFSFETSLHTVSIASTASKICEKMNLDKTYKRKIEIAAYLHDLGKICMPINILHKTDKLTKEEFDIMKTHITYTREILVEAGIDKELIELACNHHEKLDGSGYDRGLKSEQLSVGDRIISISDIFCALTEKRQYKESFDKMDVLNILIDMANKNYIDKDIVNIVSEHYEEIFEQMSNAKNDYNKILNNIKEDYKCILEKNSSLNLL